MSWRQVFGTTVAFWVLEDVPLFVGGTVGGVEKESGGGESDPETHLAKKESLVERLVSG